MCVLSCSPWTARASSHSVLYTFQRQKATRNFCVLACGSVAENHNNLDLQGKHLLHVMNRAKLVDMYTLPVFWAGEAMQTHTHLGKVGVVQFQCEVNM